MFSLFILEETSDDPPKEEFYRPTKVVKWIKVCLH